MLAAAIAGACCVGVGAVLMTSVACSAAVTVPVSVGPGGMLAFDPATVTAHQGDTVKSDVGNQGDGAVGLLEPAAGFVEDVQQQKPRGRVTAVVKGSTAQSGRGTSTPRPARPAATRPWRR
jgi:hypothetical protein